MLAQTQLINQLYVTKMRIFQMKIIPMTAIIVSKINSLRYILIYDIFQVKR